MKYVLILHLTTTGICLNHLENQHDKMVLTRRSMNGKYL